MITTEATCETHYTPLLPLLGSSPSHAFVTFHLHTVVCLDANGCQALPLASYYPISDGMTWDYTLEDERYLTIKSLRIHKLFRSTNRNSSYTNAFVLLNIDLQALSTTIPETFCLPPSSDSLLVAVQNI